MSKKKKEVKKTKLNIVNDGVFPITMDQYGVPLEKELDTGLQFPGTIQGEGKLVGTTCLFVRTSGCNLRCAWRKENGDGEICDTPFSSWKPDTNYWEVDDLVMLVMNNAKDFKHIVVTGGEPMMQPVPLTFFLQKLKENNKHITIETNGTYYDKELLDYVDLISISPKLDNSTPRKENLRNTGYEYYEPKALRHQKTRYNFKALQRLIDICYINEETLGFATPNYKKRRTNKDFQLKFVVSEEMDILEIKRDYIDKLKGVEPSDVVLMPLGSNRESLNQNTQFAMAEAVKNGWRYTPRLHVDMFDDKRSV